MAQSKLFLVSSFADVSDELISFETELQGKTVTFIPTASKVEKVKFYVDAGKKALEKKGVIVDELDISVEQRDIVEQKLRENDFIYVSGGNSFYLMQELKKSGADIIIKREIAYGKLYIGESAGAIILSKTIQYIQNMDSPEKAPELASYDGLGVVDFYTLPHDNEIPFKEISKEIKDNYRNELTICPIRNNEAILVEGNSKKVVNIKK